MSGRLVPFFAIAERGTTVRIEILGGVTTFVSMAYIIVVNPAILAFAGFPVGPATVATAVTAAFGSLLMGLWANRPIAVAPYMGENAFIAFSLAAIGITLPEILGAVFVSGILFLVMTLVGLRKWLADSISPSMKHSFAAGIGLFLAFIGLYETGIVTSAVAGLPAESLTSAGGMLRAPAVPVKIGDLHDPSVLLSIFGFTLIAVLMHRRVRGGILLGIATTAVVGLAFGLGEAPLGLVTVPFAGDYSLAPLAFELDVRAVLSFTFFPVLLTLFLMGFLDTLGTLVGVGAAGGMLDEEGNFPEIEKPMLVDALSCMFAGLVGTSTSGAYLESTTGIREGARTGLAAVTTAALFLLSLFFLPLVDPLQKLQYAYAPALIAVGVLLIGTVKGIDFDDMTEAAPAFFTIGMMVFTYNIANGLTAGLVLYPILKVLAGRRRELSGGSLVLGTLCLGYYVFGLPH